MAVKYQEEQEALRRNSLAYRNQQSHMERILEANQLESQRAEEQEQLEDSVQGWRDARAAEEANKAAARRELAGSDDHFTTSIDHTYSIYSIHNDPVFCIFLHTRKHTQKN